MAGWLAGWLDWVIHGWLAGWQTGWQDGWLAGWMGQRIHGLLAGRMEQLQACSEHWFACSWMGRLCRDESSMHDECGSSDSAVLALVSALPVSWAACLLHCTNAMRLPVADQKCSHLFAPSCMLCPSCSPFSLPLSLPPSLPPHPPGGAVYSPGLTDFVIMVRCHATVQCMACVLHGGCRKW